LILYYIKSYNTNKNRENYYGAGIKVVCPHCAKVNKIPKKDSYKKANCGSCKQSMLEYKPIEVDKEGLLHV